MADCPMTPKCIFFNDKMASVPATAEMLKKRYCRDDFVHCARYLVRQALGPEGVPSDLTPSQAARVKSIVG